MVLEKAFLLFHPLRYEVKQALDFGIFASTVSECFSYPWGPSYRDYTVNQFCRLTKTLRLGGCWHWFPLDDGIRGMREQSSMNSLNKMKFLK